MDTEQVQASNSNRLPHAAEMFSRGTFARQVAKAVDGVESQIEAARDAKVGHVGNKRRGPKAVSAQSSVAELDRLLIQIESTDFVSPFGQGVEQATGSAGRLKESFWDAAHQAIAAAKNELHFRGTIGTKDQVVVLGVVVDRFLHHRDRAFPGLWGQVSSFP
jgi:hypothetical protein